MLSKLRDGAFGKIRVLHDNGLVVEEKLDSRCDLR